MLTSHKPTGKTLQPHHMCVVVTKLFDSLTDVDAVFNYELYQRHGTNRVDVHSVQITEIPERTPLDKPKLLGYHVAIYYTLKE